MYAHYVGVNVRSWYRFYGQKAKAAAQHTLACKAVVNRELCCGTVRLVPVTTFSRACRGESANIFYGSNGFMDRTVVYVARLKFRFVLSLLLLLRKALRQKAINVTICVVAEMELVPPITSDSGEYLV